TLNAINDANTVNVPLELRGSNVIVTQGNVGIGTASPYQKLHIYQDAQWSPRIYLEANPASSQPQPGITFAFDATDTRRSQIDSRTSGTLGTDLRFHTKPDSATVIQERMRILESGNVGIGTTSPATLLEVGGATANVTFDGYKSCTGFTSNANGLLACTGSDQRLKQNIISLDATSSLAAINALNPVSFYWRDATLGANQQFGLVAQEVQSVFPNLVQATNPTALTPDGTLTVNYSGLIAPMIRSIQELDAQVRQMQAAGGVLTVVPGTEAQCVVGDTRLRKRKRASSGADFDEFESIAICDIAVGDEIQSLNESTGEVVYSRVNALMNMGVQEIFELRTASGRTIRTTGNHPFLARLRTSDVQMHEDIGCPNI
ncbi:MAG: tail fiber domain-containing protein, partial [bacterium]